jgi:hypothetical protein
MIDVQHSRIDLKSVSHDVWSVMCETVLNWFRVKETSELCTPCVKSKALYT